LSQVLALKYRPNSFDKLIGQDAIAQTLSLALNKGRLSHAYLFSGLRGSGKTSTARIFSKALVCQQGPTSTPCESCEHCVMANESRHIDIIEMDAASSRKIDDIRDLIEHTKYRPNSARYKIFIIDEVHMLTKEAFNALLKTLEEPPEFIKFILATTDPLKLPATILSRTQHFRFKTIATVDIVHHLSHILNLEDVEYEIEALEMLSRAGNGSLRDTLTLLDQAVIYANGKITPQKTASMLGLLDPKEVEVIFDTILKGDRARLVEIIKELKSYECEVVIDELISYLKESFFSSDGKFSTLITGRFFKILSESKNLLFLNADNGFVLTLLFFKMFEARSIETAEKVVGSNEKIKAPKIEQTKADNKPLHVEKKGAELFEQLIVKLKDRNHELGACFEECVKFNSYENNSLAWMSSADGEHKKTLRNGYHIIRQFVQEIFGIDTKIKMIQGEKKKITQETKPTLHKSPNSENHLPKQTETNKKEIEVQDILNDPFVKKVQNMFEVKDIKIYPKQ